MGITGACVAGFCSLANVGGNWSNGTNAGLFDVNLNNSASNTNTNLGASHSYYSFN